MSAVFRRIGNFAPVKGLIEFGRGVLGDYRNVALESIRGAKNRPLKTVSWTSGLLFALYAAKTNPGERCFREQLISTYTEMGLVDPIVRNPQAYGHVFSLNQLLSQQVLRTVNFGVFSVIFRTDYHPQCGLFIAQCDYLKPSYLTYLTKRVVDVGFLGEWRVLNGKLKDFDVNPSEWEKNEDEPTTKI